MRFPTTAATRQSAYAFLGLLFSAVAFGQGDAELRNTNIVGGNPPVPAGEISMAIPDTYSRQQNEAACSPKPSNPLQILCVFNDYRGVDISSINDAWMGWSYTHNGGQTWFSDLLPGHPGDTPNVGFSFAADPQVAALPGLALVTYIVSDRIEKASGQLLMHRLFEISKEAGAPWGPEALPLVVKTGTPGIFVDKPFQFVHPSETESIVTVSGTLKDGTPVQREVPAARIFIAQTSFVGNSRNPISKLGLMISDDFGQSWSSTKLSESQAVNQSASIGGFGDNLCTVWRRFERNKQKDAIMVSCSMDRGNTWTKGEEISEDPEFFAFDQGTSETTFRVNSYPVITHDGTKFYAFWANRINTASPFYARIVYSTSPDGNAWSAPTMLDPAPIGHQLMPAVFATRGIVTVLWLDTRNGLFQDTFVQDILDPSTNPPTKVIRNKGDMRAAQFIDGVPTGSFQVSKYDEGVLVEDGPVVQLQSHFLNDRIFKDGTVPFNSDYPNAAGPLVRFENGQWISNTGPSDIERPDDILVTWTDNRNVGGNVWKDLTEPTEYTPADVMPMVENSASDDKERAAEKDDPVRVAKAKRRTAAGDGRGEDDKRADAEPDPPGVYGECVPGMNTDRSRNQDVFSSVIRPGVSLQSPSASKPTGLIQRAHVVWVSNNSNSEQTYTVTIEDQPPDAPIDGRASFLQVPVAPFSEGDGGLLTSIPVDIDPNSTVARTVYITSGTIDPPIDVSVSDGTTVFGTITLNPDEPTTPDIENPDTDTENPDIENAEVHNPDIENVIITTVMNPDVENPDIENPDVENKSYQNPDIENPDIENPDIENTSLAGSNTDNPDVANDTLTEEEREAGYTDKTIEVTNNGNTTTAFNFDAFVTTDTRELSTQLIGTRTHATETTSDCMPVNVVQNQVIFNLIDPDLNLFDGDSNDGFFGDGTAYIAPGETILVTLRVWGDPTAFDPETIGINAQSHSCNSEDKGPGTVDCDPPSEQVLPTAAKITFDFIPPLDTGAGLVSLNPALEIFGVQWEEDGGVFTTTEGAIAGGGLTDDPIAAFNTTAGPVRGGFPTGGSHTARFTCPDGSGRSASVASASVDVSDTNEFPSPRIEVTSRGLGGVELETLGLTSETDTLVFTSGPIISLEFDDTGADGHTLDNLDYTGRVCIDNMPPVIMVPDSPVLLEAFGGKGVFGFAEFDVTATDDLDPSIDIDCEWDFGSASGTDTVFFETFFEGNLDGSPRDTDVSCSATDSGGLTTVEMFTVRVEDTTPPDIDIEEEPKTGSTDFIFFAPLGPYNVYYQDDAPGNEFPNPHVRVFDNVDPEARDSLECIPASGGDETVFPTGTTLVTCTAEDANGNMAEESFNVVVFESS